MMDFNLVDTLRIIAMEERAEIDRVFTTVLLALLAVCLAALAANLFWRWCKKYVAPKIGRHYRKRGRLATAYVALYFMGYTVYGSTKKTVITDLDVDAGPDSVICTWEEHDSTISTVFIQRRLKGATEEEAWENVGFCEGGVKHLEIDGFTIDKDYEYRAKYIYAE